LRRDKVGKEGLPDEKGHPDEKGQQGGRNLMKRLPTRSDQYQTGGKYLASSPVRRASDGNSLFLYKSIE
jgi:hypothetical protein